MYVYVHCVCVCTLVYMFVHHMQAPGEARRKSLDPLGLESQAVVCHQVDAGN